MLKGEVLRRKVENSRDWSPGGRWMGRREAATALNQEVQVVVGRQI